MKHGIAENGDFFISEYLAASGHTTMREFHSGKDLVEFVRKISDPDLVPDLIVTDLHESRIFVGE